MGRIIDPDCGPMAMAMAMVGRGGILVEMLGDVAFRLRPIDRADALEMVGGFRGTRGRESVFTDGVIDAVLKTGSEHEVLMQRAREISEIHVNPLIVGRDSAVAGGGGIRTRSAAGAT